jgi:hypothetical protein
LTLNGLHGVISQKMVLFLTIAVSTSDPAQYRFSVNTYKYVLNAAENSYEKGLVVLENVFYHKNYKEGS